jgi:hypothetical protein
MIGDAQTLHPEMQDERRYLASLAYRMLGTLAGAEDAVRNTYMQWYALPTSEQDAMEEPQFWLTRTLTRVCANTVTASSVRSRQQSTVRADWSGAIGRDRLVRAIVVAAGDLDVSGLSTLFESRVCMQTVPQLPFGPRGSIGGRNRVARRLIAPLAKHPEITILEQETPNGLGFAFWDDGCITAVGNVDATAEAVSVVHLELDPHRLTPWD